MRRKVVALAGGTGSAKLLRGLSSLPLDLTVVANVGDNIWMYGAYVCPDVDVACYTLSGKGDVAKGWGIRGDTFRELKKLSELGLETWFKLGDQDLAVCLARTGMMRGGMTLTAATDRIRRSLGAKARVLPASDQPMQTRIVTPSGNLHLQEYWVREGGAPEVLKVTYQGASKAKPTDEAKAAIEGAERVIVCPANPVTSIGPILAIPGFAELLKDAPRVVGLSPMKGKGPFSGPAGKMMASAGLRPDSLGVAKMYSRFLDALVVSAEDGSMREGIDALGVSCVEAETQIRGRRDAMKLARVLLEA